MRSTEAHARSTFASRIVRIRFPVAAKIALASAGATIGVPISPAPAGGSVLGTMCSSTSALREQRIRIEVALLDAPVFLPSPAWRLGQRTDAVAQAALTLAVVASNAEAGELERRAATRAAPSGWASPRTTRTT